MSRPSDAHIAAGENFSDSRLNIETQGPSKIHVKTHIYFTPVMAIFTQPFTVSCFFGSRCLQYVGTLHLGAKHMSIYFGRVDLPHTEQNRWKWIPQLYVPDSPRAGNKALPCTWGKGWAEGPGVRGGVGLTPVHQLWPLSPHRTPSLQRIWQSTTRSSCRWIGIDSPDCCCV